VEIDLRRKRFVMNMQLRQSFARVKHIRLKKSQIFLALFPKKAKGVQKKAEDQGKIWLQKIRIGNAATQELRMRIKYARKHKNL